MATVKSLAKPKEKVICQWTTQWPFLTCPGGGQKTSVQSDYAGTLALVLGAWYSSGDCTGKVHRLLGRQSVQTTSGQRGLHPASAGFQQGAVGVQSLDPARLGYVCSSREPQVPKLLFKMASLAGRFGRCSSLSTQSGHPLLCKPPLEFNRSMAAQTLDPPQDCLSHDHSLLGFSSVVAPFGNVKSTSQPSGASFTFSRSVSKLCRGNDAPHQVAPDLHTLIRTMLQKQQVQSEGIEVYLKQLPSLDRYQSAFNIFFQQFCHHHSSLDWSDISLAQMASQLLQLHKVSPNQARNAYSALLLVPGFDQLRFPPF